MLISFVALYLVSGVLVLWITWPTERIARRMLRHWRVPRPTPGQIAEGLGHLRRRRCWYPVIWALLGLGLLRVERWDVGQTAVAVLAALLVAELLALRPPRAGVRSRRRVFDLVPRWGMAAMAGLAALTSAFALVNSPDPGLVLGTTVLCLVAIGVVVRLAAIHPASDDPETDAVLRTRGARMALGLGIGLHGPLLNGVLPPTELPPLFVLVACGLVWIWVANPPVKLSSAAG